MAQSSVALVTHKFRVHNAKQFVESFDELRYVPKAVFDTLSVEQRTALQSQGVADRYYMFTGKVTPWDQVDTPQSPESRDANINVGDTEFNGIPTPVDTTQQSDVQHWWDMLLAKRVTSRDVSHVIPRIDWATGSTYKMYDDQDPGLYSVTRNVGADGQTETYFVMNSEDYTVFKCLYNNRQKPVGTTAPSLVGLGADITSPGATLETTGTEDNYVWKYMYTIPAVEALRFATRSYIPVKTIHEAETDVYANTSPTDPNGIFALDSVNDNQIRIEAALANDQQAGEAFGIDILTPANNALYGANYLFAEWEATPSAIVPTAVTGLASVEFNVNKPANAAFTSTTDLVGSTLTLTNGTTVQQYLIAGHSDASLSTITFDLEGTESVNAQYVSTNESDATPNSDLDRALRDGAGNFAAVTLNIGPKIEVKGDGEGAIFRAIAADVTTFAGVLETTVDVRFAGAFESITAGIDATRTIRRGKNYHHATCEITQLGGTPTVVDFRPVIGPQFGHGWDAISELAGYNVMLNARFEGAGQLGQTNGTFTTRNDFRKIGVVKNPLSANQSSFDVQTALPSYFTNDIADQAVTVQFDALTNAVDRNALMADSVVRVGSAARGFTEWYLVDYRTETDVAGQSDANTDIIRLVQPTQGQAVLIEANDVIEREDAANPGTWISISAAAGTTTVVSDLSSWDLQPYTGEVLYIEHRAPVHRSSDQTEDLKTIIQH